jgi:hypothetical protein
VHRLTPRLHPGAALEPGAASEGMGSARLVIRLGHLAGAGSAMTRTGADHRAGTGLNPGAMTGSHHGTGAELVTRTGAIPRTMMGPVYDLVRAEMAVVPPVRPRWTLIRIRWLINHLRRIIGRNLGGIAAITRVHGDGDGHLPIRRVGLGATSAVAATITSAVAAA